MKQTSSNQLNNYTRQQHVTRWLWSALAFSEHMKHQDIGGELCCHFIELFEGSWKLTSGYYTKGEISF